MQSIWLLFMQKKLFKNAGNAVLCIQDCKNFSKEDIP